jgi:hypothetical protein
MMSRKPTDLIAEYQFKPGDRVIIRGQSKFRIGVISILSVYHADQHQVKFDAGLTTQYLREAEIDLVTAARS